MESSSKPTLPLPGNRAVHSWSRATQANWTHGGWDKTHSDAGRQDLRSQVKARAIGVEKLCSPQVRSERAVFEEKLLLSASWASSLTSQEENWAPSGRDRDTRWIPRLTRTQQGHRHAACTHPQGQESLPDPGCPEADAETQG